MPKRGSKLRPDRKKLARTPSIGDAESFTAPDGKNCFSRLFVRSFAMRDRSRSIDPYIPEGSPNTNRIEEYRLTKYDPAATSLKA